MSDREGVIHFHFLKRRGYLKGSSSECFVPFPFCFLWPLESQNKKNRWISALERGNISWTVPITFTCTPPKTNISNLKMGAPVKHVRLEKNIMFAGSMLNFGGPIILIDIRYDTLHRLKQQTPRWWNHWLTPLRGSLESFWNHFFLYFQSWNPLQH